MVFKVHGKKMAEAAQAHSTTSRVPAEMQARVLRLREAVARRSEAARWRGKRGRREEPRLSLQSASAKPP